jgi:hypothetical protein
VEDDMPVKSLRCKASDNKYLHKDFHGALSTGIEYLHSKYGEEAVREYLARFAGNYYSPVTEGLRTRGLPALAEHFVKIYAIEGAHPQICFTDDELTITVDASPAVEHMKAHGYEVARLFHETDLAVYQAICRETPFDVEMVSCNPDTGGSVFRFYRRKR